MSSNLPGTQASPSTGGTLINGRYRPTKRLGSGSFGEIYMGIGTGGEKVAIKFEKTGLRCPQLRHEYKVYRELQGCTGIGRVHHYGTYGSSNVMVMDILGASLEDLFTKCGRRFSLKTTLKLADQLLERVDAVHGRHLIHRDIKPANFVMGSDTSELCFCIDFGLSKRYRNPHTLAHIPHRVGKSLTGTPRYASINNHLGIEQARRDDLEAIGYVLVYFLKGRLPWQGLKARNASRKYKMIMEKKQSTSISALCAGCPPAFAEYLSYCRSLKFEASPNIKYLRQLFRDLYQQQGYPLATYGDADWDWNRYEGPRAGPGPAGQAEEMASGNPGASRISGAPSGSQAYSNARTGAAVGNASRGANTAEGSRPMTSGAIRPQTAVTTAAHPGSIGGGENSRHEPAQDEGEGPSAGYKGSRQQLPPSASGHKPRSGSRPETMGASSTGGGSASAGMAQPSGAGGGGSASAGPGRAWSSGASGGAGETGGAVVRRPASAHGARSSPKTQQGVSRNSFSGAGSPTGGGAAGSAAHGQAGDGAAGGDGYVVGGVKSMMTYRRSRADSAGNGSRGMTAPGSSRVSSADGRPSSSHEGGGGGGGNPAWSRSNKPTVRPKSAGMMGSSRANRSSGMGSTGGGSTGAGSAGGGSGMRSSQAAGQRSNSHSRTPYYMSKSDNNKHGQRQSYGSSANLYPSNTRSASRSTGAGSANGSTGARANSGRSPSWSARVRN